MIDWKREVESWAATSEKVEGYSDGRVILHLMVPLCSIARSLEILAEHYERLHKAELAAEVEAARRGSQNRKSGPF